SQDQEDAGYRARSLIRDRDATVIGFALRDCRRGELFALAVRRSNSSTGAARCTPLHWRSPA
ncbi:hypothetical protein ACWGCW_21955, partial [Streptomyces sp. NPDC054933]